MASVDIRHGDCLDVLRTLPDCSVHAVVTDPPYELSFMSKGWDSTGIAYSVELWAECLRVLRPGGHLASFGGTRTYHRMACAVEDAGFEIRDSLHWIMGSGFPKSLDVSKAIDKAAGAARRPGTPYIHPRDGVPYVGPEQAQGGGSSFRSGVRAPMITAPATDAARTWQGWGTALKPAVEPIVLARKPLVGTVAVNVQAHGTGALNIDGCRVHAVDAQAGRVRHGGGIVGNGSSYELPDVRPESPAGRWPANMLLSHGEACGDVCQPGCPVAELDAQSGTTPASARRTPKKHAGGVVGNGHTHGRMALAEANEGGYDDQGGASRFFPTFRYQAKAPTSERPKVDGVAHPTVKPLALMRWLVRLITPPGGTVLDPFAGSGTTVEAALLEGFDVIAVEREADYLPLIAERVARATPSEVAVPEPGLFDIPA